MESAVPLAAPLVYFIGGLLFGTVLAVLLDLVKRRVSRINHPLAADIAPYVYWILAALVLVDTYILYIRHLAVGRHFYSVIALYLGALLSLAGRFRPALRQWLPRAASKPSEPPAALRPATQWEHQLLSPEALAIAAFSCWCVSLMLPVFILNGRIEYQGGWDILTRGWLGILQLQFAWFANPLLLIAFIRLANGRGAMTLMMTAVLVSLETFLTQPAISAYGYGWGMVAWFTSLALMAAAAFAHELRGGRAPTVTNPGVMLALGVGAFVLSGVAVGAWSFYDHQGANAAETQRMAHVAIKRGEVCRVEVASVVPPRTPLAGPLEIKQASVQSKSNPYGTDLIYGLANWGVPVLRSEGRDYFYILSAREALLTSVPAQGPAGATLEIDGSREVPHLRLLDADGRELFNQYWQKQAGGRDYCPDFSTYPDAKQQPRLLVTQTLGVVAPPEQTRESRDEQPRLNGQVIARTQTAVGQDEAVVNGGCASGTGWRRGQTVSRVIQAGVDNSFWIGQQAYYTRSRYRDKALCQGPYVFLYDSSPQGTGKVLLTIEKRRLADFAWVGGSAMTVEDAGLDKLALRLDRVDDAGQGLTVDVSRPALGLALRVKGTAGL